jgi:hypothetical protein
MLAERLSRIVSDVLKEFESSQIIKILEEALDVATERSNFPDYEYKSRTRNLRERAQQVIDESTIQAYPEEQRAFIEASDFSDAMPPAMARVVLHGLPDSKAAGTSAGEFKIALDRARSVLTQLGVFSSHFRRFKIGQLTIPAGQFALDVNMPRPIFANDSREYLHKLEPFLNVMACFTELLSGTRTAPSLVYISTTDPEAGLGLSAGAAWGVLKLYKLLLGCIEKTVPLVSSLKTMRDSNVHADAINATEETFRNITRANVEAAVSEAVEAVPHKVDNDRMMEIKNELINEGVTLVDLVTRGARVSVAPEALGREALIEKEIAGVAVTDVRDQLAAQSELETKVTGYAASLGFALTS